MLKSEGLAVPEKVTAATISYRQETDIIGTFIGERTAVQDGNRLPASELYTEYAQWAKENGYRQMNHKNFIAELRRRHDVRRGGMGHVVVGLALDRSENPFAA